MKRESQLINDVEKIRHIPCTIVQGRYDVICPLETAWQLHKVSKAVLLKYIFVFIYSCVVPQGQFYGRRKITHPLDT